MGYSILSLSDNQSLLSTRQYILESAAYAVTSSLGYKQAEAACGQGNYDLAIIGHSFSFQEQEALITLVRARGDTLILVLRTAAPGQSPSGADGMFELAEGAQAFLVLVGELLKRGKEARVSKAVAAEDFPRYILPKVLLTPKSRKPSGNASRKKPRP